MPDYPSSTFQLGTPHPPAVSYPQVVAPLYAGDVVIIACPEHGHVNTLVITDDEERQVKAAASVAGGTPVR